VLNNLLGNAMKFTDVGEVILRVSPGEQTPDELLFKFEVQDTGIGIPLAVQSSLFNPFSQADASTTRKYGGTGLGLTISAKLAQGMSGTIEIESEPGRGSTFYFTASFGRPSGSPAVALKGPRLAGRHTLVADDNATSRATIANTLRSWAMVADTAASGEEALAAMHRQAANGTPYEIAIVEAEMAGMDGGELARKIRAAPDLAKARLLLMSPVGQSARLAARDRKDFDGWLTKPVRPSHLHRNIARRRFAGGGAIGAKGPSGAFNRRICDGCGERADAHTGGGRQSRELEGGGETTSAARVSGRTGQRWQVRDRGVVAHAVPNNVARLRNAGHGWL
jgi:two-component system sensor histidine kinase/response regulator